MRGAMLRLALKRLAIPLFLAGLCAAAILISRSVAVFSDDAFISFTYAKNLLRGHGLTYNGEIVQGYTNPLWVLLISGLARIGLEIPDAGLLFGYLSVAAAITATYCLARRLALSPALALVPSAVIALSLDVAIYTGSGLETVLFTALLAAVLIAVLAPARDTRCALTGGLAAGLLALCRPEGLAAVIGGVVFVGCTHRPRVGLIYGFAAAAIAAPWFIWARAFYGDWLPNSFYAKASILSFTQVGHGLRYLFPPTPSGAAMVAIIMSMVAGAVHGPRPAVRWLCLTVLAWLFYVILVGGDFMPGLRLVLPAFGIAAAALCVMGWSVRHAARPYALLAVAVLLAFTMTARWLDADTHTKMGYWRGYAPLRTNIGLWLHDHAPPGSLVAVNAAGMIAYYSELPVLDMLGINDRYIARHGHRDLSLPVAHQVGDGSYVLSRAPDYVLVGGAAFDVPTSLVSERELASSPSYRALYHPVRVRLPYGMQCTLFCRPKARSSGF